VFISVVVGVGFSAFALFYQSLFGFGMIEKLCFLQKILLAFLLSPSIIEMS